MYTSLQCRRFCVGAHDRKFAEFAAILAWEKWVGRGWEKWVGREQGCIFVSPQASSEFESKMALAHDLGHQNTPALQATCTWI